MTLADFRQSPWQGSHQIYKNSAFAITPAPEYASSEVLVSSLYRTIGFEGIGEGSVPQAGRDLDKMIQKLRDRSRPSPDGAIVTPDTWNTVLHGVLESPKRPQQSSARFLQVTPLVPDTALFSGSARLSSKPWRAGGLVRRMAWLGSSDDSAAHELWGELFAALSVGDGDDVFARWLQAETGAWMGAAATWKLAPVSGDDIANLSPDDYRDRQFPARQFARDVRAIVSAKDAMTRRQWTSLLEAVLRLASVSHVAWLCDVNSLIWSCVSGALQGVGPDTPKEAREMIFPSSTRYMAYGGKALLAIKDKASSYLSARLGLNAVLWSLEDAKAPFTGALSSSDDVAALCRHVRKHRKSLLDAGIHDAVADINEGEARALLCKNGIGGNMQEFARHVLGQRLTANPLLRGYDQGYVLRKKGLSASSPWIVSLGPVSVLALVHCALAGMDGPRSVQRLGQHLGHYGIIVDRHDIASNDLGHQLRMLGLVLDSPDAESGMLLLPPFRSSSSSTPRVAT